MRKIEVGKIYKHFKGNMYKVIAVAKYTENDEYVVVYMDLSDNKKVWARPYEMFNSYVDKIKYPNIRQKYRFEEHIEK